MVPAFRYRDGLPAEHHTTYDHLLSQAVNVQCLDYIESTARAHMAASEAMLNNIDLLLAVWDGNPARGFGGTADVVEAARDDGIPVKIIEPAGTTRGPEESREAASKGFARRTYPPPVMIIDWWTAQRPKEASVQLWRDACWASWTREVTPSLA
jgi:hypothetical protein